MATWTTTQTEVTWTAVDDPSVTWTVQVGGTSGGGGGATNLDGLTDVVITAAASGDILRHNGTNWVDTPGTDHFEAAGAVAAHTGDTTDAHDASAISIGTLNGNLSAVTGTDVEQALQAIDNLSLGGSVATDTVWDAAGDLVYGTGADAATRLPLGARGQALVAGATAPEWAFITPRTVVPMAAGDYVLLSTPYGAQNQNAAPGGSVATSNSGARYLPFFVGKRIGVSALVLEVQTGNAGASAVIRMGIHANNDGRPGSVVVDAGTASAAAAVKELSFSQVFLDPGWYYAVVVFQNLDTGGTNPLVRAASSMSSPAPRATVPGSTSNHGVTWGATVSGALAADPTVSAQTLFVPHIWLKVSTL